MKLRTFGELTVSRDTYVGDFHEVLFYSHGNLRAFLIRRKDIPKVARDPHVLYTHFTGGNKPSRTFKRPVALQNLRRRQER